MAQRQSNGRSRAKSGTDRKQEIIDTAAELFKTKGYEATSIQDVADAVDILKGSLYYYIKSKDDLLYEVIQEVHERGLQNLEASQQVGDNAVERLHAFVYRHVVFNANDLSKMTVFFNDFRSLSPDRRAEIVEERDQYDTYLRSLIEEGVRDGLFRPEVDPKMAAFSILGSMNWLYQWYKPDGSKSIEDIAESLATMAVNSIQASAT